MRLIAATKNKGKLREIKKLLKGLKLEIVSLNEVAPRMRIKENGKTFFENALIKAKRVSKHFPQDFVAGEDSGLEVNILGNRPGIYSKRYAGKHATDLKNNLKLLKELEGAPKRRRRARFRCIIALVKEKKLIRKFEGILTGFIYHEIKGKGGFGYDPVMYVPFYKKTVAQLPLSAKNKISHRAKAFQKLNKYLLKQKFASCS